MTELQAHILDRGDDHRKAKDIVLEARIYGHHLSALCGATFAPSRDPLQLSICTKCEQLFLSSHYKKGEA